MTYGNEFVNDKQKCNHNNPPSGVVLNEKTCNPLYTVRKSEWVADKIERKQGTIDIKKEQNKTRTPVHEREHMIRMIEQLQQIHTIRGLREHGTRNGTID